MVRTPASQLGDPSLNLCPVKNLYHRLAELGPTQYIICVPVSKLGGETPSWIRAWSCRSVTKTFQWEYNMQRHLVDTLEANCSGGETAE